MISLELSKKLKSTGLEWEPKFGDSYISDYDNGLGPTGLKVVTTQYLGQPDKEHIWLPSLEQLLAEIEKRGWRADSVALQDGGYGCDIFYLSETVHTKYEAFEGDTREEAAGQALLWILERKKGASSVG